MCQYEALVRLIITKIPIGMEGCGKVVEEKCHAVRLARLGGGFDQAGELRGELDQLALFFAEPFEVKDGYATVPTRPGNGIEWNEDAVRKYAY